MSDAAEVLTPEIFDLHDPEHARVMERRQRVLSLKLSGMSQLQIAAVVKVNQATVSRDLQWLRENWRKEYGIPGVVNPAEEIGEAVAMFRDTEEAAKREFHRAVGNTRAQMSCLRTAMIARQMRLSILQDVGLLERQMGTVHVSSTLRANDIRSLLRDEGLLTDVKRSRLGPAGPMEDDDLVEEWLKRGEA